MPISSFHRSVALAVWLTLSQSALTQTLKDNPGVMTQVRLMLTAKGIPEAALKDRLRLKGIDVDTLSEAEIIRNRPLIEQALAELEAARATAKSDSRKAILPGNLDRQPADDPLSASAPKEAIADLTQAAPTRSDTATDIYGHSLFRTGTLQVYRVSRDASPPDAYVLAPGDKINILIFGASQADLQYEINPAGYIRPNLMPMIFLGGLTLAQARELVAKRFSTYYRFEKDQFALTLNTSRTLNINIFGEVVKAGSYTTSALNTALNALAVGGGPTDFGSVRNIQIIRGNSRKTLDVYAFMRNPILQFDFFLQNNDIIHVPPAEKIVTLEGSVNRPMRYELRSGEGINELIGFAGGLRPEVYTESLQIQRYEDNKLVLKDYSLADVHSGRTNVELHHGDIIRLRTINSPLKGYVHVTGPVEYDGNYDLSTTPTLKALLGKARLRPEAKTDQAFIIRRQPDATEKVISCSAADINAGSVPDIRLQNEDEVVIYEQARFTDRFNISVVGEVRNPFERAFRYDDRLTLSEALGLAGGPKATASRTAYIYRTNPFRPTRTRYIRVELTGNDVLEPGDRLVVLDKTDYEREATLEISGEVLRPTRLRYDSSLSLADLIRIAGGTTLSANLDRIDIFRLRFSANAPPDKEIMTLRIDEQYRPLNGSTGITLQPFDVVVVRRIAAFTLNETVEIRGEVKAQGRYVIDAPHFHFSDLVARAGGLSQLADQENITLHRHADSSGILVFDAKQALKSPRSTTQDPILRPGDIVDVPKLDNVVKIETAGTRYTLGVMQTLLQVNYQGRRSASWYIRRFAGGFNSRADRSTLRTIRENGLVNRTRTFLFLRNYPKVTYGDRITMELKDGKPRKEKKTVREIDWDKAFTRILALASTLAIILSVTR
jgi:protein involved in polysaccharide export with SLBB domain